MQGVHKRRTKKKEKSTRIEEKMIVEITRTKPKSVTLLKKRIMMKMMMR